MSGYAGGYAISPFPTGPGVGTEATDKAVLYWDGVNNLVKGSGDFIFNETLKQITLGAGSQLLLADGSASAPSMAFSSDTGTGVYRHTAAGTLVISTGGSRRFYLTTDLALGANGSFQWSDSNNDALSAKDLKLYRDAAGILAQRNGTNAQAFRLYNTYSDANNYERARLGWVGGVLELRTEYAGTGAARDILINANNTYVRMGHTTPVDDAARDLGLAAYRWRSSYFGGAAASVPISVKANASQTANLQEWQNSSGTALLSIDKDASIVGNAAVRIKAGGASSVYLWSNGGDKVIAAYNGLFPNNGIDYALGLAAFPWGSAFIGGVTASNIPLTLRAHASQSANLQEWQNSSGTPLAHVDKNGYIGIGQGGTASVRTLCVNGAIGLNVSATGNSIWHFGVASGAFRFTESGVADDRMSFRPGGGVGIDVSGGAVNAGLHLANLTDRIGQIIKANASQTANLQEWQNSSGTAIAKLLIGAASVPTFQLGNTSYIQMYADTSLSNGSFIALKNATNQYELYSNASGALSLFNRTATRYPFNIASDHDVGIGGNITDIDVLTGAGLVVKANGQTQINNGVTLGTVTKTANYTALVTDHMIKCSASGGAFTITLPAAASSTGLLLHIKKTDSSANRITIDGNASELVEDATTQQLIYQGENLMLQCDGTQWWVL